MIKNLQTPKYSDLLQLVNFCIVGLVSTTITLAIIYVLMSNGSALLFANFLGYLAGIALNFILNSSITFKKNTSLSSFYKFLFSCLIAYVVNLIVILSIITIMPEKTYFSQLVGMVFYTITNFVLNKYWAMR